MSNLNPIRNNDGENESKKSQNVQDPVKSLVSINCVNYKNHQQDKMKRKKKKKKKKGMLIDLKQPVIGDEIKVQNEESDGYKTPISLEQKIPIIKDCPPPPSKSYQNRLSIRRNPSNTTTKSIVSRRLLFDLFEAVQVDQSMFNFTPTPS